MKKKIIRALSMLLCVLMCVSALPVQTLAAGTTGLSIRRSAGTTVSVKQGEKVTITIKATGGNLKYQWFYRKNAKASWVKYSGKTKPTLSFIAGRIDGYQYRCRVSNSKGTTYSKIYTLKVDQIEYRALLIGETYAGISGMTAVEEGATGVAAMKQLLARVAGGKGGNYSVVAPNELKVSKEEIKSLIDSTFSGADDNDVALFYFAGSGDVDAAGANAGRLFTDEGSTTGLLTLNELASKLKEIKGEVIVILATGRGSGAGLYENGAASNARAEAARFNKAVISAFAAADRTIVRNGPASNTGELRSSKFYVLTDTAYQETGWSYTYSEGTTFIDALTYHLLNGTAPVSGALAADADKNSTITLGEMYAFIKRKMQADMITQNVQVYPSATSTYPLFKKK